MTTVVHVSRDTFDVYIGRARQCFPKSKWHNPYKIGPDGTRSEVIAKYRVYVLSDPELLSALHEVRGKRLGCWCKPRACHGDVLAELADNPTLF